jgi:hypothetical protein
MSVKLNILLIHIYLFAIYLYDKKRGNVMSNTQLRGKSGKRILTVAACCFLVLFTLALLAALGIGMACNLIFHGPSETARDELAVSLLKSDTTAWIPTLYLDKQTLAQKIGRASV